MRLRLLFVPFVIACHGFGCGAAVDDNGRNAAPLSADDYPLTLKQAEAQIREHTGPGCLRMLPYVECHTCGPRYRLEPIAIGNTLECGKATFDAGGPVTVLDPPEGTITFRCEEPTTGGVWRDVAGAHADSVGAIVCR